ncbi:MAG: hypothetical protein AAF639_23075 [Chloroflexota bacterium]
MNYLNRPVGTVLRPPHIKTPYQKQARNAILLPLQKPLMLIAMLIVMLWTCWPQPVQAQWSSTDAQHLLLVPLDNTSVELHTHTVDFSIQSGSNTGSDLQIDVDAFYRLQNESDRSLTLLMRLVPALIGGAVPEDLSIESNQSVLDLRDSENGYITEVSINADDRAEIRLRYRIPLAAEPYTGLHYDMSQLSVWPGELSLRINVEYDSQILDESWLYLAPTEWNFAPPSNAVGDVAGVEAEIKWLYEATIPSEPFAFYFIHPIYWQAIDTLQQQVASSPAINSGVNSGINPDLYLDLGRRYRQLSEVATLTSNQHLPTSFMTELQDRFYAQSLAAYTAGIVRIQRQNLPADTGLPLYVALADLYRSQVLDANGALSIGYAALMAQAAEQALGVIGDAGDQSSRTELYQWQIEGLTAVLNNQLRQAEWRSALSTVEQLVSLPDDVPVELLDRDQLDQQRRNIIAQQALDLLEEERQDVGDLLVASDIEFGSDTLSPPLEAQSLFEGWIITTTIRPEWTDIELVGIPTQNAAVNRVAEAQTALQELIALWQASAIHRNYGFGLSSTTMKDERIALHLRVVLPPEVTGSSLARGLSTGADWAMLREILGQIDTQRNQQTEWFWQKNELHQAFDLRAAGDQWSAMASNLERQANAFEEQATAIGTGNTNLTQAESVLQARIQAANYRETAQIWQTLIDKSWMITTLVLPGGPLGTSETVRSWLITPLDPPDAFFLTIETFSFGRLIVVGILILFVLFITSGLLWWLL